MTRGQFLKQVELYAKFNPGWRAGQAMFHALRQMRPALAVEVHGTPLDPFHRDDRIPEFLQWLGNQLGWKS